jgi:hypothetical protein
MRIACWIPKATKTHSEYVIFFAFPLQQWLRERASVLRYTYITSLLIFKYTNYKLSTRWRSWLGHRATSRKVAVSIPDGVIGIFNKHNPSGCTMTLVFTQPLTEMSTSNIT